MTERRRVAFVVDRCSETTFGGAPRWAHAFAQQLGERFATELLTTTARDYMTWENVYPPGSERLDGVEVRRFTVDRPRAVRAFDRLSRRLASGPMPPLADQERWMRRQGPMSSSLFAYLAANRSRYDAFVFVSYLYATSYFGLPLVADRAVFVPLAHDEWMLRFTMWDRLFALPRTLVYNTEEERDLVAARFPASPTGGPVIGAGIAPPADVSATRFRTRTGIAAPFALYLGRLDPSKGCLQLLRDYAAYRREAPAARELVLIGERYLDAAGGDGVHVLGALDEATKWDALAACDLLVLPSRHESLSLAVLEAWAAGKPALVDARAAAVVGQCRRSGAGLWYADGEELIAALHVLDDAACAALGARGADYVAKHYRWEHVAAAFADHLATTFAW